MSGLRFLALPFAVLGDAGMAMLGQRGRNVERLLAQEREERLVKLCLRKLVKAAKAKP